MSVNTSSDFESEVTHPSSSTSDSQFSDDNTTTESQISSEESKEKCNTPTPGQTKSTRFYVILLLFSITILLVLIFIILLIIFFLFFFSSPETNISVSPDQKLLHLNRVKYSSDRKNRKLLFLESSPILFPKSRPLSTIKLEFHTPSTSPNFEEFYISQELSKIVRVACRCWCVWQEAETPINYPIMHEFAEPMTTPSDDWLEGEDKEKFYKPMEDLCAATCQNKKQRYIAITSIYAKVMDERDQEKYLDDERKAKLREEQAKKRGEAEIDEWVNQDIPDEWDFGEEVEEELEEEGEKEPPKPEIDTPVELLPDHEPGLVPEWDG